MGHELFFLKSRATIIWVVGVLLASSVVAVEATVAAPTASLAAAADALDPTVQGEMMIDLEPTAVGPMSLARDEAIVLASTWLGRSDPPAVAAHGSGRQTATDAATRGWIIVFGGGKHPLHDDESVVLDFIGVLMDDSGTVLRTFGRGHQP